MTVNSLSENPSSPKSVLSSTTSHTPPQPPQDRPGLCVSAQVEHCGGGGRGRSYNTLGSMVGGLQAGEESPALSEARARGGDKPDLLPGSIPHL